MTIKVYKEFSFSLNIDCQKGFSPLCPDELPVPDGHLIVPEILKQNETCKYLIGSKDAHPKDAYWVADEDHPAFSKATGFENIDTFWPEHCISGTKGAELLDGLPGVLDYDFFVYKGIEKHLHPYSLFYHDLSETLTTGVLEFMYHKSKFFGKYSALSSFIFGGLALDFCLLESVRSLEYVNTYNPKQIIVNLAATKAVSEASKMDALAELGRLGITVIEDISQVEVKEGLGW
jgi:nicotinamidase/pyrazinamidase